ncbi:tetratricopeptide repeat protein [Joostella atrarenae]|uniref:Tetratricopeptide repeat protein n=1 Tax=Joostella atrarenae TaxID=679257 RepID=A0ABS9J0U6_9FLAO|nr:tetratricopeptide repeat protein [Joostella atrarenae]MCF8714027.1 tetratricopeptide repeat protein [Joostella atrarenae]
MNAFCKPIITILMLIGYCLSAQNIALEQANTFIKENKITEAEQVLLSAYKKKPTPIITERLGDVYGIEKKWDDAATYYKILVDEYPKKANYHYKYGGVLGMISLENKIRALSLLGDVKKHFEIAANLDDEHLGVRWASIDLYLKLPGILGGSNDKAYKYSKELEAIAPIEGYLSRGFIEEERNNKELAATYYKRGLDVVSQNTYPDKNYRRQDIHYQIGKLAAQYNYKVNSGISHLLIFENLYTPESTIPLEDVYYQLAVLYRYQKNKEKANYYIDKAIKIHPNSKDFNSEKENINGL